MDRKRHKSMPGPNKPHQLHRTPKSIPQLPKDVLQRIFYQGMTRVWPEPEDEYLNDSSSISEDDDDEEHEVFTIKGNQSRPRSDLATTMKCAMVCRKWADAVLDMPLWRRGGILSFSENALVPWILGTRWNKFLESVPVLIPCSYSHFLASIGKIELSAKMGRTHFTIYFPMRKKLCENLYRAWRELRSYLWKHCTHLELVSYSEGHVDCVRLGSDDADIRRPWPRLQSLRLGPLIQTPFSEILIRLGSTRQHVLEQNPFFPALKFMAFQAHPDEHLARDPLLIAPNIEECQMDTSGFRENPHWDMHRNCISHLKFLEETKRFRTYVTAFCMYAFKWPGPKRLDAYKLRWKLRARTSPSPEYGVLISEKRDDVLCELRMSIEDFFAEEDLTELIIPSREGH